MFTAEFWVAVAFVIFIGVLIYFGAHRMILDALDQRSARIKAELDEARRLKDEAQALLAEYQRKQGEAEREAADILAGARAEAERLATEAKAKSEEFLARRTKLAETKIAQAEAQALADVRNAAAEAAVAAAEKVLTADRQGQGRRRPDRQGHRRGQKQAELAAGPRESAVSPSPVRTLSERGCQRGDACHSFAYRPISPSRIVPARITERRNRGECGLATDSWRLVDHFDCNGVLVDSEPIAAAVAAHGIRDAPAFR